MSLPQAPHQRTTTESDILLTSCAQAGRGREMRSREARGQGRGTRHRSGRRRAKVGGTCLTQNGFLYVTMH